MEGSNPHNHGYWFVLREDQGNVIFSSNNVANVQNPHISQIQEQPRYIVEAARPYTEVDNAPAPPPVLEDSESNEKPLEKWRKTKDDTFWDKNKLKLLLTLSLENKNVDKDIPWDDIASIIGATPLQCNIKYRHLRRTYLRLLRRKRMGKDVRWVHYDICEEVFTKLRALPHSVIDPWDDYKIKKLLTLYIEYLPRFRNPNNCLQKDIWKEIGAQLGTTGYHCYHKFKNLKRSYITWLNRNSATGRKIRWAYYPFFERIYQNHNPNKRAWDRLKIQLLLDAYAQLAHKFRKPKFQKKELWNEISRQVGETPDACDKKFRNLKQTYVRLRTKANCGRLTTKWRYFRDFEAIYGNFPRHIDPSGTIYTSNTEDYIKQLLEFYLNHKDKFRDPLTKNKTLWKKIAPKLGLSPEECDKKFRNLKQTYVRLAWKKRQSGKCSQWPYFSYFEKIYDEVHKDRDLRLSETVGGCETKPDSGLGATLRELRERRESHWRFERLVLLSEESNQIQRERNRILQALLNRT